MVLTGLCLVRLWVLLRYFGGCYVWLFRLLFVVKLLLRLFAVCLVRRLLGWFGCCKVCLLLLDLGC